MKNVFSFIGLSFLIFSFSFLSLLSSSSFAATDEEILEDMLFDMSQVDTGKYAVSVRGSAKELEFLVKSKLLIDAQANIIAGRVLAKFTDYSDTIIIDGFVDLDTYISEESQFLSFNVLTANDVSVLPHPAGTWIDITGEESSFSLDTEIDVTDDEIVTSLISEMIADQNLYIENISVEKRQFFTKYIFSIMDYETGASVEGNVKIFNNGRQFWNLKEVFIPGETDEDGVFLKIKVKYKSRKSVDIVKPIIE